MKAQDILNTADYIGTGIETEETINMNGRTYDAFKMLSTKDVAEILECSPNTAQSIMHRDDFPLIKVGKNFRVSEKAFAEWLTERHV